MKLNQCNCVVTGASSATGTAIRTQLLKAGAKVIATQRLQQEAMTLKKISSEEYLIGMDPMLPESVTSAVQVISSEMSQIHVWINTIGGFQMGELIENTDPSSWEIMHSLNFSTVLNCTQAILPHFKKFGTGRLINFGSAAVTNGMSLAAPYLTSKAAVHALSKATAAELDGDITCNAILPTTIDTPANRQAMPDADFSSWVNTDRISDQVIAFIENSENGKLVVL